MDLVAKSPADRRVAEIVEPAIANLGFDLVRVRVWESSAPKLQIMAERREGQIDMQDCVDLSRVLSPLLEEADPVGIKYVLEISSPGIDRPLTRVRDFETYTGSRVKIELGEPFEGQKRFRGRLLGLRGEPDDRQVALSVPDIGEVALPFSMLAAARVTPDASLYEAALSHAKAQEEN